jgi:hypothetical protein
MPAWLALLLAATLLCAVLLAVVLLPRRPLPPPALQATQNFELQNGESVSLQSFSITATGGFRGYKRGADSTGDILEFVRDGSSGSETARVVVQRKRRDPPVEPGMAHAELVIVPGWVQLDQPLQWPRLDQVPADGADVVVLNGIHFHYDTFEGQGERAGRRLIFVEGDIGEDSVTFTLNCPTSIWPEAFDGLAALVASVRPTAKDR